MKTREVILLIAAQVGDYFAVHSWHTPSTECLRDAASTLLFLPTGASVSLTVPETTIRWAIEVTPAVRRACRALLRAEQAELAAAWTKRAA